MSEILTFQDCVKKRGDKRHLILGNGFSVALFPKIFNYKALKERVSSNRMLTLFEQFETADFEYIMRKVSETLDVIKLYEKTEELQERLETDLNELKETLITVISESHPESPQSITEDQYLSCQAFLSLFNQGKVYTFNYDLLLYWVYMKFMDDKKGLFLKCDDGFRTDENDNNMVSWEIGREHGQNIYYIHGAMHLFSKRSCIEKFTWSNKGVKIKDQVRQAIEDKNYPVFIAEGSDEHKMMRIKTNGYLARSFSSLKSISGDLFIFGHSLRDEDNHVFDLILKESSISKFYISIFKPHEHNACNEHIRQKVQRWREQFGTYGKNKRQREFILFDAETVKVWG
jgi:hypothetical protein